MSLLLYCFTIGLAGAFVLDGAEPPQLERSRAGFRFHLDMPYSEAAPLFGPLAEKKWDPEWNPEFLYPSPAADVEGSVFAISGHAHRSIWTTTVFDLANGHIQYLYFIEGAMVTRIDIHLNRPASGGTDVSVLYERTALSASANAHVKALGDADSGHGVEWKNSIEKMLGRH